MAFPPLRGESLADSNIPGVEGFSTVADGTRGDTSTSAKNGLVGTNGSTTQAPTDGPPAGNGVFGFSKVPNASGVIGIGPGAGVIGFSEQGDGTRGDTKSETKNGLVGTNGATASAPTDGPPAGNGVFGFSSVPNASGVIGIGPAAGVSGFSGQGPGVLGKSGTDAGVIGFHGDPRLQETTVANDGGQAGVFGASDSGGGVVGYSRNPQSYGVVAFGGIMASPINHPFAGEFFGNVMVHGDIFLPGGDCAEHFDVAGPEIAEPGSVVVIGEGGGLSQSETAYDKRVAGVVSGAGSFTPGIILDKHDGTGERLALALAGKVYCKVDAEYASIEIGDLLTTSPTPGHAMKARDRERAFGAVIGKALGGLAAGQGLLPILVCLQ